MEKLLIRGCDPDKILFLHNLNQFTRDVGSSAAHDAKDKTFPELLISKAGKRKKFRADHIYPSVNVDEELLKVPQTLQELLCQHPFPRSQGPLRMPIKSENLTREFTDKALFPHSDSQLCAAWV